MDNQTQQFLVELKDLLEKYKASVSWTCNPGSDLHGVSGEKMKLAIGETAVHIHGDVVSPYEINELLSD